MSDIQLRTDEHVARTRGFYDAQRYDSQRDIGNTIGQMGRQIPEIMQMREQLDQKWVDIGQRAAAQHAEIDIAQKKLLTAQALDQTELSRQNVRAVTLQNDLLDQQVKESKKRMDLLESGQQARLDAELAQVLNRTGNEGRYKFDPNAPLGKRFTARTDEEFKAWTNEQRTARSRLPATGQNFDVEAKRAQNEWIANLRARDDMVRAMATEEELASFDRDVLDPSYERHKSFRGAPSANGTATKKETEKPLSEGDQIRATAIAARIANGKETAEQKAKIARAVLIAIPDTLRVMQQARKKAAAEGGETERVATEQEAIDELIAALNDPNYGEAVRAAMGIQ